MNEPRQEFRTPAIEVQIAVMSVGHERLPVKLFEESSGGLSIVAQKRPEFPCESFAELQYADGQCLPGQVKYIEQIADGFRIGFQRREMISNGSVDLRDDFHVDADKEMPAFIYALVLLVGLGLGLIWKSGNAFDVLFR